MIGCPSCLEISRTHKLAFSEVPYSKLFEQPAVPTSVQVTLTSKPLEVVAISKLVKGRSSSQRLP